MTDAERRLWSVLRDRRLAGVKFRRQKPAGHYFTDFWSAQAKLVIEVDGGQHSETERYDAARTRYLNAQGWRVIRFWNAEVLTNLDGVVTTILEAVGEKV